MTKEELQKEAEERADEYTNLRPFHISYEEGYFAGAEPREKRIAELEQENERLKGDLELWESGGCRATNLFECGVVKELKDQLTKAKEHIKQLLDCLKQDTNDPQTNYYVCQYMNKAEQFLKSLEK